MVVKVLIFNREDAFFVDNSKYCFLSLLDKGFDGEIYYLVNGKFSNFLEKSNFKELRERFLIYGEDIDVAYPEADWIIVDSWFLKESFKVYQLVKTSRTRLLQLWHGIPIKNVSLVKGFQEPRWVDYAISTSEKLIPVFSTFLDANEFIVSNYFRNLCFLNYEPNYQLGSDENCLEFIDKALQRGKKICFYMPTFRWQGFDYSAFFEFLIFLEKIALKYDIVFIVKLHVVLSNYYRVIRDNLTFSGIFIYEPYLDAYPALRFADLLITDYSSVVFDYFYLEKPVIFYFPDFNSRTEELLPYTSKIYNLFPLAKNPYEIVKLIKNFLKGTLTFDLDCISSIRKEFFSTDKVLDVIKLMEY